MTYVLNDIKKENVKRTSDCHKIFHKMMSNIDSAFDEEKKYPRYNYETFKQRVLQRLLSLLLPAFALKMGEWINNSEDQWPIEGHVELGGIIVNSKNWKCSISKKRLFKSVLSYLSQWFKINYSLIFCFSLVKNADMRSSSIIYGVGKENVFIEEDDSRFVDFCQHGSIDSLKECSNIIVELVNSGGGSLSNNSSSTIYAKNPILFLLSSSKLGFKKRLRLLLKNFVKLAQVMSLTVTNPLLMILSRDFAYEDTVQLLDDGGFIYSIELTTSNYNCQYLWMREINQRKFQLNLIWYALNVQNPVTNDETEVVTPPGFRYMYVDKSWVWNEEHIQVLNRLNVLGTKSICGPLVWHLPERANAKINNKFVITIFDVAPHLKSFSDSSGFIDNYYKPSNMISFLKETIEVIDEVRNCTNIEVLFRIKRKRDYNPHHEPTYISLLEGYISDNKVEGLPFHQNIYSIVDESDLCIVAPFSSPLYIANERNVKAFFYDPTMLISSLGIPISSDQFVAGRKNLKNEILELICSSNNLN